MSCRNKLPTEGRKCQVCELNLSFEIHSIKSSVGRPLLQLRFVPLTSLGCKLIRPDEGRGHKFESIEIWHSIAMPLDTSTTYRLTRLRLDGRRWNELRLIQAQISTNPASSGSSYLAMGNTVVICNVHGPAEGKRSETAGGGGGAVVSVVVNIAGFAGIDRKKKSMMPGGSGGGGDR